MSVERREQVTHVGMETTGKPEELRVLAEAGRLPWGGTSRMRRESHVRICERLGVQFPGPTRPIQTKVGLRVPRAPTSLFMEHVMNFVRCPYLN
jgi:hypothetical protein